MFEKQVEQHQAYGHLSPSVAESRSLKIGGSTPAEALAEQKRVRELLAQSRDLLKQIQAD